MACQRYWLCIVLLALILLHVPAASAAKVSARKAKKPTYCSGVLRSRTIPGDLIVDGEDCELKNVIVRGAVEVVNSGSLTVDEKSQLLRTLTVNTSTCDLDGTIVSGAVEVSTGGSVSTANGSELEQTLVVDGAIFLMDDGKVKGAVQVLNGATFEADSGSELEGTLEVDGATCTLGSVTIQGAVEILNGSTFSATTGCTLGDALYVEDSTCQVEGVLVKGATDLVNEASFSASSASDLKGNLNVDAATCELHSVTVWGQVDVLNNASFLASGSMLGGSSLTVDGSSCQLVDVTVNGVVSVLVDATFTADADSQILSGLSTEGAIKVTIDGVIAGDLLVTDSENINLLENSVVQTVQVTRATLVTKGQSKSIVLNNGLGSTEIGGVVLEDVVVKDFQGFTFDILTTSVGGSVTVKGSTSTRRFSIKAGTIQGDMTLSEIRNQNKWVSIQVLSPTKIIGNLIIFDITTHVELNRFSAKSVDVQTPQQFTIIALNDIKEEVSVTGTVEEGKRPEFGLYSTNGLKVLTNNMGYHRVSGTKGIDLDVVNPGVVSVVNTDFTAFSCSGGGKIYMLRTTLNGEAAGGSYSCVNPFILE